MATTSRRRLYREGKRLLSRLLLHAWPVPRRALDPAVRRFLRARPRRYLLRLVGDRAFALAAAASLLATGAAAALPPVNLTSVAQGTGGFAVNGNVQGAFQGFSVSGAGDVNGDGLADVIVGESLSCGEAYVVFGKVSGAAVELADVAAGNGGFVVTGGCGHLGASVSSAGDVNGDGLADVIVGAPHADPPGRAEAGASYVVFGKTDGVAVDVSDIAAGIGGFIIIGAEPGDRSGYGVSGAGDVDGDGLPDLIVGAPFADAGGPGITGESYVLFGKADGTAVDLADVAAGIGGFAINGGHATIDNVGFHNSGAGDVNGDRLADVILGGDWIASGGNTGEGQSFVVFGKADGTPVNLAVVVAGSGGFVINGVDSDDHSGRGVSGAGDVNGDGLDDVIVGARYADPAGNSQAGESYVVFGKADGTPVELAGVVAGSGGFVINGIDPYDRSGWDVSGAGDVNGDGLADVIVGALTADQGVNLNAGESYVVFGKADGTPVNLSALTAGSGGFIIEGIDLDDESGCSVSGAGDVNGDGLADVIVGVQRGDPGGLNGAGESYVVFSPIIDPDLDNDGSVGITDFALLLGAWGRCPAACPPFCLGDIDHDCTVGVVDFLLLLGNWS